MHRHPRAITQLAPFHPTHPITVMSIYVAYAPKCLINLAALTFSPYKARTRVPTNSQSQAAFFGGSRPSNLAYSLFAVMTHLPTPIKNHRYQQLMAMIFFILGMLFMARLHHVALS